VLSYGKAPVFNRQLMQPVSEALSVTPVLPHENWRKASDNSESRVIFADVANLLNQQAVLIRDCLLLKKIKLYEYATL
jgi:hypothetical protein